MSTPEKPIWSRCSITPTLLSRSHFQRTLSRKEVAKVRVNIAVHQQEKENTGNREVGDEEKTVNRF